MPQNKEIIFTLSRHFSRSTVAGLEIQIIFFFIFKITMITLASASAEGLIIFMHNGTVSEAKLQETRFQTRVNLAPFLKLYSGAIKTNWSVCPLAD